MVTHIPNVDPTTVKTVQITPSPNLSAVLPTIAIGDIINFTVRQNSKNGKGLISLRGALIEADLPAHLKPGDKVESTLQDSDGKITFKINSHQPTKTSFQVSIESFAQTLQNTVRESGTSALRAPSQFSIQQDLLSIGLSQKEIDSLFAQFAKPEILINSQSTLNQIFSITNGSLATSLREAANTLKQLALAQTQELPQNTILGQHLLESTREALSKIIEDASRNNKDAADKISKFIKSMEDKTESKLITKDEKHTLSSVLKELAISSHEENISNKLETILKRLPALNNQTTTLDDDPIKKSPAKLKELATKFEQMAATQELLGTLNPIMQALGEPALILFPFMFHGLITHAQVSVEPKIPWRKKGKKEKEGDPNSEPYQRIQMNIPLPAIGTVGVDVAHRKEEILVRLTIEDPEIAHFIDEKLEDLAMLLRKQGFTTTDLATEIGDLNQPQPEWSNQLSETLKLFA